MVIYPYSSLIPVLIRKTTISLLRVSINLTNCSEVCETLNGDKSLIVLLTKIITTYPERYSDAFFHQGGEMNDESLSDEHGALFELLLLSLGLMINFAQESDTVKELILSTSAGKEIRFAFEDLVAKDVITYTIILMI
jgi:hypothetical protein